jgi:hypothetical protein
MRRHLWCLGAVAALLGGACRTNADEADDTRLDEAELEALMPAASALGQGYRELDASPPDASADPDCNGYDAVTKPTTRASRGYVKDSASPVVVVVDVLSADQGAGAQVFDELGSIFASGSCARESGLEVTTSDVPPPPTADEAREVTFILKQNAAEAVAVTRSWRYDDVIVSVQVSGEPTAVISELADVSVAARRSVAARKE